jgi:hypothetical protein
MTLGQAWITFAAAALQANIEALHSGASPAYEAHALFRESWEDARLMMDAMPDGVKAVLLEEGKDPS